MPAGRPTSYRKEYAKQARKLCVLGATDQELAGFFGVSRVTIDAWKAKHTEFLSALKVGKGEPDDKVERSLYQRAVGYSCPDTDIRVIDGKIVKTEIIKHYPPDPTSMIFWLKNRRKDEWRDRQEVTGADGGPIQTEDTTSIELARSIAFLLTKAARADPE